MAAFLLTWKEGGWDYSELRKIVREFNSKGVLETTWRLRSSRAAKEGDRVWLLEQGAGHYGIFGAGTVIGPSRNEDDGTGKVKRFSPIRFTHLVDPRLEYLIGQDQVARVLKQTQLTAAASGYPIEDARSERLEELLKFRDGEDWDQAEIVATVNDYFSMLDAEIVGTAYSKAQHRRALRLTVRRSHASIEFKHQNISAVLDSLHLRWIKGYPPHSNLQQALREAVEAQIAVRGVETLAPATVNIDVTNVFVAPPVPAPQPPANGGARKRTARKIDTAERDAKNRVLGAAGEGYVVDLERQRLKSEGRADLAAKVSWVAKEKGDGLGYDLESYLSDGQAIFIEVKTTCGPIGTPFYLSAAELAASAELGDSYRLYRVFDFDTDHRRVYVLQGSLDGTLRLEVVSYRAVFKGVAAND